MNLVAAESPSPPRRLADDGSGPASPEAVKFLDDRISFFINDYKAKRDVSRSSSNALKALSLTIGGTVTVLIGVRALLPEEYWLSGVVSGITLLFSAVLTSIGAWEAFADHRWK
jgi:hypothetical protein